MRRLTIALLSGVAALLLAATGNGARRSGPTFSTADLEAVNCEGHCGFDVASATRAYADGLDATARRVS